MKPTIAVIIPLGGDDDGPAYPWGGRPGIGGGPIYPGLPPGFGGPPGWGGGWGSGNHPSQGLPGSPGHPSQGLPGGGGYPSHGLPGAPEIGGGPAQPGWGFFPGIGWLWVWVASGARPDQGLPPTAETKPVEPPTTTGEPAPTPT